MNPWDAWVETVKVGSLVRIGRTSVHGRVVGFDKDVPYALSVQLIESDRRVSKLLGDLMPPSPLLLLADQAE